MWIDDKHEINDCESLGAPTDISSVRIGAGHFTVVNDHFTARNWV